jgi:hypothetical protein
MAIPASKQELLEALDISYHQNSGPNYIAFNQN